MYSKQEASAIRQSFWTAFGQYLAPIPGAGGYRISWINYKTGIRDVFIKMDATSREACIEILMAQKDPERQSGFFNKLVLWKPGLEEMMKEAWIWDKDAVKDGRKVCRIYKTLPDVNIFDKDDWPRIITFLKDRIILLDAFWLDKKEILEIQD